MTNEQLIALLTRCVDPVSESIATARMNLETYKGYSSRERRYGYELQELEKLMAEITEAIAPAPGEPTADSTPLERAFSESPSTPIVEGALRKLGESRDDGPCLICGKPWYSGHTADERKACDEAL